MKKRMFFTLLAVFAFIAAIGSFKFFQVRAAMAQGANFQPPPETVTTIIATAQPWDSTLSAIGTVTAVNGVMVSADMPGLVDEIAFESGRRVNRGDVLVRLDTKQERAQLAAAQSQRDLARLELDRQRGMLASSIIPQSTFDQAAAQFKQAEARVGEIAASIERKTIRAPFAGTLGIRLVNRGQYLAGGAPIVSLQSLQPVYVDFSVPQQEIGRVAHGAKVQVTFDGLAEPEFGTITAVDSVIDEATRNARVQATFANTSARLRPGMFVQAQLAKGGQATLVTVPASAISYAPFGDSVFVIEQMKGKDGKPYKGARQQFVKLGPARGDQVAILSGVKPGDEVATAGVFKLRPGAAVQVNNELQPANASAPKPEDS